MAKSEQLYMVQILSFMCIMLIIKSKYKKIVRITKLE